MKYDCLTPFTDAVTDTWMRSVNTQKHRGWCKIHAQKMSHGVVKSLRRCVTGRMMDTQTEENEKTKRWCSTGNAVSSEKKFANQKFSRPVRLKGAYVLTIVSKKLSNEIGAAGMQPARTS